MEMITISKRKFERMELDLKRFKNSRLYARLLEFEENIKQKKYSRSDVGF